VNDVNDLPTAGDDSGEGGDNTIIEIVVANNDTDIDGTVNVALIVITSQPSHGSIVGNSDGAVSYRSAPGYSGSDSFTYTIRDDDNGVSNEATVSINVVDTNTPPAASDDDYTVSKNGTLNIPAAGVLANDGDADSDPLTTVLVADATGTLSLNPDGSFTYTPVVDFVGSDSFTYKPNDGQADGNVATVTINVTALSVLNIDSISYTEGDAGPVAGLFTVTLSPASGQTVEVDIATAGGSATVAGGDYEAGATRLTFNAGETSKTFSVNALGDTRLEATETFIALLSNPANAALGISAGTGSINDDDIAPAISFTGATSVHGEGAGGIAIPVMLDAAAGVPVTVTYTVADGSAAGAGVDYALSSGELTIPAGDTTASLSGVVVDDGDSEGDENFTVTLSAPVNATLGAPFSHTATIADNDAALEVTLSAPTLSIDEPGGSTTIDVELSAASGSPVTVELVAAGTAGLGTDFSLSQTTVTIPAGQSTTTVTVDAVDDFIVEGTETATISLSNPQGADIGTAGSTALTVIDNDSFPAVAEFANATESIAEGSVGNISIELSVVPVSPVTLTLQVADGTATGGDDYTTGSLTIVLPIGTRTAIFPVSTIADGLDEDDENLTVSIANATSAVVGTNSSTLAIILDGDPTPSASFTQADAQGSESVGFVEFDIELSTASGRTVTVGYSVAAGTAGSGSDYIMADGVIAFPPGSTSESISAIVLYDLLQEADEDFTVTIDSAINGAVGAPASMTYTIIDDDDGSQQPSDARVYTRFPAPDAAGVRPDSPLIVGNLDAVTPMVFVPGSQGPAGGPSYDIFAGRDTVSVREYLAFLNFSHASNGGNKVFFAADGSAYYGTNSSGVLLFKPAENNRVVDASKEIFDYGITYSPGQEPAFSADSKHETFPILGVTWFGALKYCNWLTRQKGLPGSMLCYHEGPAAADWRPRNLKRDEWADGFSDAERAEWLSRYPFGYRLPMDHHQTVDSDYNEFYWLAAGPNEDLYGTANGGNYWNSGDYFDNGPVYTTPGDWLAYGPVGYFGANDHGLYNMSGNVWEWQTDTFSAGDTTQRTLRGGSWYNTQDLTRTNLRFGIDPTDGYADVGFRVVCAHDYEYQVELSTSPAFTQNVQRNYGGAGRALEGGESERNWYPVLDRDETYYWRARTVHTGGAETYGPWVGAHGSVQPFSMFATSSHIPTSALTLDIASGWSLLSTNVEPTQAHPSHLFGLGTVAWGWDASARQYARLFEIKPFEGFWLHRTQADGALPVHGYRPVGPADTMLRLQAGHNLVGPLNDGYRIRSGQGVRADMWQYVDGEYRRVYRMNVGLGHWLYTTTPGEYEQE
jgi:formylglycine-generating enzyme required for sulfatase activity